jgi:hypothetical protein
MEAVQPPSIAKLAMKYGLINGVLAFVLFLIIAMAGVKQGWLTTAISIAILVVLMVLAHRDFKKTHESMMTYGQGVGSGTLLSVIGTVVASILVFVYIRFINTGYPAAVLKMQRAALEERGLSGAQLDQSMAMVGAMVSPVGIVVTSLVSGVVVGFIVALIVSAFTKARDPNAVY